MNRVLTAVLFAGLAWPAGGERVFDIDGAMELHIWMTAKQGHAADLERTFEEVFYPAVSARPGFRSALLVRRPNTDEYTVRLSFDTEELRVEWVASDEHQRAWPALSAHAAKVDYDGFSVVHPR